jgi:glutamate-1-semialdehyde 2,1-aminomutase
MDAAMHAGGLWGTTKSYLKDLRLLTKRYGILLIFDEVITGFRLSSGGAQKHYGITPDLCTFAKAMGAGEKIAAVAGKKKIMDILDPSSPSNTYVFQSGTVNDGTSALSSTIAALKIYKNFEKQGKYNSINKKALTLKNGLTSIFNDINLPCQINQVGSMLQIFISPNKIDFFKPDKRYNKIVELFYLALINHNILLSLPTSNHIYLSFMHTDKDIKKVLSISKNVLNHYNFNQLKIN